MSEWTGASLDGRPVVAAFVFMTRMNTNESRSAVTLQTRVRQQEFESPAQRAVVALLVAAGQVQQALAEICERHGITHDQYNVLRILAGVHPEGHPRYEIADRLINRAPDVTRLLDRLEDRRLVGRVRSTQDRRLSLSRITPKGLRLLDAMAPAIRAAHARTTAALSVRELEALAELCGKLID
jgi:DNA-binding MarR family transcriptional regulator